MHEHTMVLHHILGYVNMVVPHLLLVIMTQQQLKIMEVVFLYVKDVQTPLHVITKVGQTLTTVVASIYPVLDVLTL